MISTVLPLHAGNALRLYLQPPAGAARWKVLRKGADSFTGHDDPGALVAYEGTETVVVDDVALRNEVMAFYRVFYTADGTTWTDGGGANGTPRATYRDDSVDVLSLVRDRLEAGLKVECDRGTFATELGYVQVFRGAISLDLEPRFPLVTCHLESEPSGDRAIGEDLAGDAFDAIGDAWEESEGWLEDVVITVIGWSLNGDERNELRKAIRRIIQANMPVFASHGLLQIDLKQEDLDAVSGEYNVPMYQVMNTFSCVAPARVLSDVAPVRDVIAELAP